MGVTVSGPAIARGVRRREIARKARIALEAIDRPRAELSIVLTGDEEIRRLNREYRGKDTATDVLSFSLVEGAFGDLHEALGDVVISLEMARRQAQAYGAPLEEEVERLLVHGVLHLVGHDHETSERDAQRMRREERRVRARLTRQAASAARARKTGRKRLA